MKETPYERFCAVLATLIANSDGRPSTALRDRLVREFQQGVPERTPEQYQRAMALIARAANL